MRRETYTGMERRVARIEQHLRLPPLMPYVVPARGAEPLCLDDPRDEASTDAEPSPNHAELDAVFHRGLRAMREYIVRRLTATGYAATAEFVSMQWDSESWGEET